MSDIESINLVNSPVLICGMHRSGTSLVAQLLNTCGLHLGNEVQLMQTNPEDNPTGYWEYTDAVQFADSLLSQTGSSWKNPKNLFSDSWLIDLNYEKEKQNAIEIFKPLMDSRRIWGWKDPRATILLPFWQKLFPRMKLVICLRNPLEVAFSLSKRYVSHVDFFDSLKLWKNYYELFTKVKHEVNALVTHYESLFYNPQEEITRLCNFTGLNPSTTLISTSITAIEPELYRIMVPNDFIDAFGDLPEGLQETYSSLCSLAGKQYQSLRKDEEYLNQRGKEWPKKIYKTSVHSFDNFYKVVTEKNDLIEELSKRIYEIEGLISYYSDSRSWRITEPLRKIMDLFRKKNYD